jgi:hypothetical protein
MARQNNDSLAVPQDRRKTVETDSARNRGGKRTADDEQTCQLDLFIGTAERGGKAPTESGNGGKRNPLKPHKERKPVNKSRTGVSATMERIRRCRTDPDETGSGIVVVANRLAAGESLRVKPAVPKSRM